MCHKQGLQFRKSQLETTLGIGDTPLTVILYGTIALLWLFGAPQLRAIPILPGLGFAYPELGYGLIAGAAPGIGWSVIFTAIKVLGARRGPIGRPKK
jgi:hypothetical protein